MGDWFAEKVHGLSLDDIINMDWSRGETDHTGFCEEREAFAAVGIRPAMYPKGKNRKNMTDVVGGYGSH